jgi:Xaa-Pro aminopeptidase
MLINQDRARGMLAEAGLDGLVATTQENLLYMTGILNVNSFVLPRMVQAFAVAPADRLETAAVVMGIGDADQYLAAPAGIGRLYTFGTFFREAPTPAALDAREQRMLAVAPEAERHPGPAEALAAAIRDAGLAGGRIGIDEEGIQSAVRARAAELVSGATFVDAAALFRRIRMVKTAAEVERLRRAQAACENGIKAVAAMAQAGVTERDMVAAYATGVIQSGGRATFALIKTGRGAALGQLPPSPTPLARGDHVWFDVGAQVDGYHADLARILVLGPPSKKLHGYYAAVLRGEEHAFAATRPGMPASRLFDETIQAVRAAGIPHYRRHHVGHGIGAEVYDPPVLNASTPTPIEAGMVINIETPYYELGWGAVHVEDPYVVGADGGNTWLTTMSRDLIIIE